MRKALLIAFMVLMIPAAASGVIFVRGSGTGGEESTSNDRIILAASDKIVLGANDKITLE